MMVLTKKILQCYPNGFGSYMITGRRGIGKTSYCLRALHDAYISMGCSENDAWTKSLDSLQFSISDVVKYLREAVNADEKKICLIFDDARVGAGGVQYHLQMRMVAKLSGLLDVVRTAVSTMILTCPNPSGLLGVLKSYDDYQIKIKYSDRGSFYREATGYLWNTLPSGQRRIYTKFRDNFSCYLPVDVYNKYMIIRKQAFNATLEEIEKIV